LSAFFIRKICYEQLEKHHPENSESDQRPGDYVEEESKKKDDFLDGETPRPTDKEIPATVKDYVQNSEQNASTLWNKLKNSKNNER
jgi:hypothetical protein